MADNIFEIKGNIDVVFCIDGTGSMTACIQSVKSNARKFLVDYKDAMRELGYEIGSLRARVIVFRDYKFDGDQSMVESPFFELPADNDGFEKFLSEISAKGGGDGPENGLEALYYAMKSDFIATARRDRQIIILFTDADALELKERAEEAEYPSDMVDEDGLIRAWSCMEQNSDFKLCERNKRLIMFAPDGTKYQTLHSKLNRSVFEPVNMADGLGDIKWFDFIRIASGGSC